MKNKKGFTLIELLTVLILLIVIVTMAVLNYMPSIEKGRKKALVDEAFVVSEGGLNKYADDRLNGITAGDLYAGKNSTKRCYPLKSLLKRYVDKSDKNYRGSVEICIGDSCTYTTKIWLTDGEYYLESEIVDENLTVDDLTKTSQTDYLETCGVDLSNVENAYYFDFIGAEETFVVPVDGTYSLEAWGASGGGKFHIVRASFGGGNSMSFVSGGKGGYSYTEVDLKAGDVLYVTVGGEGPYSTNDVNLRIPGGYNGGGMANYHAGAGGGATHIALKSGQIYGLDVEDILIVAGGGGGATESWYCIGEGASGWTDGGYAIGGRSGGGNCESYGRICNGSGTYGKNEGLGGGGGLYTTNGMPYDYTFKGYDWGGTTWYYECQYDTKNIASGGTGYIGNIRTKNGIMYSYSGVSDSGTYSKTVSTSNYSSEPIATYAKDGNGFARIVYLGKGGKDKSFDYKGAEATYTVPETGTYKLEVWGAQGGDTATGGYAKGEIKLTQGDVLYINVGGKGQKASFSTSSKPGGYNGGGASGRAKTDLGGGGSGGGATSIATASGILSSLSSNRDAILIVAGGGGGDIGNTYDYYGGNGGGFKGNNGYTSSSTGFSIGGSQTSGYAFGQGATGGDGGCEGCRNQGNGGSGGGFYGGNTNYDASLGYTTGAGGSGYIGNSLLTNKVMYCNSCAESTDTATKTISTYCYDNSPRSNCAKSGNGYAKISLVSSEKEELPSHLTVYYDNGTSYKTFHNSCDLCKDPAVFGQDRITLGTGEYGSFYTDTIDLSQYNSLIFKRTNGISDRIYFAQTPQYANNIGDSISVVGITTDLGDGYYVTDLSSISRSDLVFSMNHYWSNGSGEVYFIAFSTQTVSQIVANHSYLP